MAVKYSKTFKRDLAKWLEVTITPEFNEVMYLLQHNQSLPEKYRDHPLKGEWIGYRDCRFGTDLSVSERRTRFIFSQTQHPF